MLNPKQKSFGHSKFSYWVLFGIWCLVLGIFVDVYALDLSKVKTYFLSGDYKSAISEGERILAKADYGTHSEELYYILALSYLKDGNYLRASDIFEIILKEFKGSAFKDGAILGMGDVYLLMGDLGKAQEYYKELIRENVQTKLKAAAYYRLSQIEIKNGNLKQANEYLDKVKNDFPLSLEASLEERGAYISSDFCYSVQVGSFTNINNSRNLSAKLIGKGYDAYVQESSVNSEKIYRVKVGRLKSRAEAVQLESKLSREGFPTKITP